MRTVLALTLAAVFTGPAIAQNDLLQDVLQATQDESPEFDAWKTFRRDNATIIVGRYNIDRASTIDAITRANAVSAELARSRQAMLDEAKRMTIAALPMTGCWQTAAWMQAHPHPKADQRAAMCD